MPINTSENLKGLETKAKKIIKEFVNEDSYIKVQIEPVAFGLNSLLMTFTMNESLGSPDPVAEKISKFKEVASADIIDVRRALG